MALTPGVHLGPYEVVAGVGQGGMGEVYRARDTKLGRDVALKILPDTFAQDRERLARFEREAQLLASLNHPNIASIYGIEEGASTKALVLEYVEGPTLAERLAQTPGQGLPLDESLLIVRQIAEALESAHNAGVIHRDLKPANIKLRPDGTVKVLDFGLAKAMDTSPAVASSLSMSPTITTPAMTQVGFILGTAAYMSPEQARGKTVDKRADIWAFGVVVFEMLTGRRPFAGEEVSDVLASVLAREPQFDDIPEHVPALLRQVIKACLQKDPKQRIHDIADVRLALAGAFETVRDERAASVSSKRVSPRMLFAFTAVAVIAAAVAATAAWMVKPAGPRAVMRFGHRLTDEVFSRTGRPVVAISRDGRRLAYVANSQLYLRSLDEAAARPIPGTDENPSSPFFSPDGEWIGFWSSEGALKKIRVAGGTSVLLAKAGNPLGVSWGRDDQIVYALSDGIWRVSGNGGMPERLVEVAKGERIHAPQMLPGGNFMLFTLTKTPGPDGWDEGDVVVQRLDGGERRVVHTGGADPRYVPTGHLVYALGSTLFAVPFDLDRREVEGGPVPVLADLRRAGGADIGIAQYAISENGTLVYVSGRGEAEMNLALADRSGSPRPLAGSTATAFHPRFNHDDSRIAVHRVDGGVPNIWIYEISQSQWRQLTFDGGERPVWTPDGSAITYRRESSLWQIPTDFSGAARQLPGTDVPGNTGPFTWSPDGTFLLYGSNEGVQVYQARSATTIPAPAAGGVLKPPEGSSGIVRASFSPDGRWVVYAATSSGGANIFVTPFPFGAGGSRKIMNDTGNSPVWSRDGREIFVNAFPGVLQVLGIRTAPRLDWDNPQTLFTTQGVTAAGGAGTNYDVTRDGKRLLLMVPAANESGDTMQEISIVLNWHDELQRLVPSR